MFCMMHFKRLLALITFVLGMMALRIVTTNEPEVSTFAYICLWIGAVMSVPIAVSLGRPAKN